MVFDDVDIIRHKMNEYGKMHLPFLFILNYEMTEGYFIEEPMKQDEILFCVNGVGNKPDKKPEDTVADLTALRITPQSYKSKFDVVYEGLVNGESYLTNLTVKTPVETKRTLRDIFLSADTKYQLFVPGKFVCFSPECFVRIADGIISAYPMKGTIDAAIPDAEQIILSDRKETEEHKSVVELLSNDIGINAGRVRVERFRYIDRIRTNNKEILQVSSEIAGDLPTGYHSRIGDIIFSMLPAGSIAGAPKTSTVELIRKAEKEERGYYTGVFGYYDGNVLDSGVLIRFIEEEKGQKFYRSGGGITILSDWEKEYAEVSDKIYLPVP